MPITWNDFDKIWAVSSPLTPYTFSDLNYAAGWDFIGSTPPARQMWDSLQKANDEKFKFLRDNFGTPNMVTTAAQMTDTDKIYVYVGSEAGWNNGHWYYYDAGTSTWVDGGVYNSTAFVTDTTLTEAGKAADAKAVGDALALKADLAGATFTGNVAVNADFSTTGDATVASDLTVSGATALTGNVTASGNVSVVGDIDADNITLTGDISATDVTASGDVTAGALSVSGATTLTGNVTAGADITATGDITANDASFANATLSGTLSVTGATTLDGLTAGSVSAQSLNTTGNVSVGGTLTVSAATTLADVTANDINVDDITATGDITADDITANTLAVSGASTLTGNITAGADITVTGDISVNDITASGDITADDVTANGNLSVVGNATLSGASTAVTPAEDDNSTKIATTAYVQTEIKPIETDVTINDKRISNIEKLLQGQLYDYQTDSDSAYTKTVPNGAMPYASLNEVGGKTVVWNQINKVPTSYIINSGSLDGVTVTITDGVLNVVGTPTEDVNFNLSPGAETIPANHKLLFTRTSGGFGWSRIGFGNMGDVDAFFHTYSSNFSAGIKVFLTAGTTYNFSAKFNIFDLTLLYGAGNEPTTVAEFQQMFPAQYYSYNAGQLLSAGVTEVVSVGANRFNGTTYQGYYDYTTGVKTSSANWLCNNELIEVEPSTNYYITFENAGTAGAVGKISCFNAQGTFLGSVSNTAVTLYKQYSFTTLAGTSYIGAYWGNQYAGNSVCIAKENAYYPYNTHSTPIPAEIQALEGYGWSAGTAYNYIDYEAKKFVKRVASVDLGTLNWTYESGNTPPYFRAGISNKKYGVCGGVCSNYIVSTSSGVSSLGGGNGIAFNNSSAFSKTVFVVDSNYTDKTTFTSAMSGVYLYYELDTPIETDISAYITDDNLIEVEAGGTLTFPNSNGTDYQIPVPSSETYMVDLQASL